MKRVFLSVSLAAAVLTFAGSGVAQKVRLRAQITPQCPTSAGNANWKFADIYADGNIAVQGSYNCRGAFIYDISNPDAPVLASWYNPGNNQQFLEAIVVGNRGYFGSGNGGGVHIVDLTNPYNPVLLGIVDSTRGNGYNSIHEMVVFSQAGTTYLLENYNLLSSSAKILKFINVTDPANPVFKWDLNPADGTWVHAVHIRGTRMFTSGWGGKIEIYDISSLATQTPRFISAINGLSNNHSSWTSEDGNYLYSCREIFDGDIQVYDIRNPTNPLLIKTIKGGDLGLNAITPHNPVVVGNYLYVSWYQAGLQVFDISNPADPVRVGQYDTFQTAFAPTDSERESMINSPWNMVCGGANLQNVLPNSYDGNWAIFPFLGQNKILAGDLKSGLLVFDVTRISAPPKNTVSDFDGDGRTDLSVFTGASGTWSSELSSTGAAASTNFGLSDDVITAADFDGDGKSDIAVWRPSDGYWYILGSSSGFRAQPFGTSGDVPVAADYDADGKADVAVWRPSNGVWYVLQSTLGVRIFPWGTAGDKPLAADFDGDGKADSVVWRPSNGTWYVLKSSSSIPIYATFGTSGDKPLAGDFTGDGLADYTVYRPSDGTWYILNGATGAFSGTRFGISDDIPVPADYDGDGRADVAVFRPGTNTWYRLDSSSGAFFARVFGQSGDRPSPSSNNPR